MAVNYKLIRLIEAHKDEIWLDQNSYDLFFKEVGAPNQPKEHFQYIKSKNGEMIIANKENEIFGWIGLIPENNACELAGIEVNKNARNMGIGKALMNEAKLYLLERNLEYLYFGTTPLFTSNSLLYLHEYNAKYIYNSEIYIDKENTIPWPYVECTIDFKSNKEYYVLPDTGIASVINWKDNNPIIDEEALNDDSEYKFLYMKYFDAQLTMNLIKNESYNVLKNLNYVFKKLNESNYRTIDFVKNKNDYIYIFKK